jgi:PAS domain S-box-containing protein
MGDMKSVGSRSPATDRADLPVRVLHVDDERTIAETTASFLETEIENASVAVETDPATALERLDDEPFDCIVSDYQMPEMDGVELLEAVRETHPDLPFILFTGKGSEEVASEAISAGVTDYLRKEGGHDEYAVLARQIKSAVEHRRAVERFEGFLESAPDAITIVDVDGAITEVNEQAEEMFGYDRSELLGEPIELLIPERYRGRHADHRERYVRDPETRPMGADIDLYALRADGSEFPVDIALSPVRIGDHVEVMAAIRDISTRKWREEELREREQRLQRQNERLDEFASVVSHDLQNLLTAASAGAELTRRTDDLSHLEQVDNALDRMETLVEDLLTLAREGQTVEDLEPVDLASVATEAWTTIETAEATLELEGADVELLADEGRLKQVLENLFHNAVQHGARDVTVRVGVDDGRVFVADDGPGIPVDKRDEVFDYGFSTREEGNGYGLAIVRSIVEAHGWEIIATESGDGGARFEITGVELDD